MNPKQTSLVTANAADGLKLAARLAEELQEQVEAAKPERPGGMNYLLPAPMPKEMVASILFYAITLANGGWTARH